MTVARWQKATSGPMEVWHLEVMGARILFSSRRGGQSRPPYHSLNLGLASDDDPAAVRSNLHRFLGAWAPEFSRQWHLKQIHSSTIIDVSDVPGGETGLSYAGSGDGLVSCRPGELLMTFHADCVPVYAFDPVRSVVGLAHAGWRGTAQGVTERLLDHMVTRYGTDPRDLFCAVGPAVGPCCYEVDEIVMEPLSSLPYWRRAAKKRNGKWALDLGLAQREGLLHRGVMGESIALSRLCTSCSPGDFYSYRRDGPQSGRMVACAGLVEWGA